MGMILFRLGSMGSIEFVCFSFDFAAGQQWSGRECARVRLAVCAVHRGRHRCDNKHQIAIGQNQLLPVHMRARLLSVAARNRRVVA